MEELKGLNEEEEGVTERERERGGPMLPYATAAEAEAAVGRGMTWAEAAWFRYSASIPDYCLYCHNVPILLLVYTLAPLPLALLELRRRRRHLPLPHKLQPGVRHPPAAFLRCYAATARVLLLAVGPVQLASYPAVRAVGIRTGLPLPSAGETAAQVAVYLLVEDYLGYWIHRLLHTPWAYHHIHRVHHEFTAPMGYAAPWIVRGGGETMEAAGTKRMRTAAAAMSNGEGEEETASQGSAGGGAAASSGVAVTAPMTETEDDMAVAEEEEVAAETEEHVQRILLAIDAFTRQVSEMLEAGRALFKNLAADFEDRLCSIHKERVERWEEEIRELRARDAANEQARSLLHNAQLHLLATVRHDNT
uniref:Uncharacterized protein n=2 Tax=Oryza meridionalis TaxID=40149 RepID=A0A0E0CTT9_9ORYZ